LDALFVEGLVHITELGGEYFRYDEVRQELRGERTGIRYHLGSPVQVQVSRVDLDGRRIDFRLLNEWTRAEGVDRPKVRPNESVPIEKVRNKDNRKAGLPNEKRLKKNGRSGLAEKPVSSSRSGKNRTSKRLK